MLKAVSNRTFDAHLSHNCRHFVITLRRILLFTTIVRLEPYSPLVLLEWLSFIFASVCSFVDVNPTFQFLKHLSYSGHSFNIVCFLFVLLFSFLFCTSLNSSRVVQLCFCFSLSPPFLRISIAVFHRNFIAVYTQWKHRVAPACANASKAILEMLLSALLFLPDLHPPRVRQTCHVTKRVCEARDSAFLTYELVSF